MTPAPASLVDDAGLPRFGAYLGAASSSSWDALRHNRGRLWELVHRKRWHYVSLAGERVVCSLLVIDLGWAASCFAYVFDRRAKRLRRDLSFLGVPGVSARVSFAPAAGARTSFRAPFFRASMTEEDGRWSVRMRGRRLSLDARLDGRAAPPTLCAVAPIEGGIANCTHKTLCLPVSGALTVDGETFDLADATGSFDHTSGLLARDTRWRWASAAGRRLGFNLVEGFNGPVENVAWIEGKPVPVGAVRFSFGDPLGEWRIQGNAVDLTFQPEGARKEDKNLLVAKSWYVQPIGAFRGRIAGATVDGLPGVTEDHIARW
jgi:hypothetical protein